MKKINLLLLSVFLIVTIISCKKDDEKPDNEFDVTNLENLQATPTTFSKLDGASVSSKISIANATKITGSAPQPTSDAGSPQISSFSDDENIRVATGRTLVISPYVSGSDIAGYYVQIDGASEYYDVPVSNSSLRSSSVFTGTTKTSRNHGLRTSRVSVSTDQNLEIEIPSSISTGEFCLYYCVYDSEGRISNAVLRCVDVQQFGGTGAEFITSGRWNFNKYTYVITIDGETETETINAGEIDSDTYEDYIMCADNTYQYVEVNEEYKFDNFWVEFAQNGGMQYSSTETGSFVDDDNSTCENVVYKTETKTDLESGAWAYNNATKTLTLLFDGAYETEDGTTYYSEPYFEEYRVNENGNQLIMSFNESYDFDFSINAVLYFSK